MRQKRLCSILLALFCCAAVAAKDSTEVKVRPQIYQGVTLKVDIATPIIEAGLNDWKMQSYEMALNVRLKNHFYPTIEGGYAGGRTHKGDSIQYHAHGGFFRVGLDVNPLRKHPESPHAFLLGFRVGTAFQPKKVDCWGEIVAGCQVEVGKVGKTAFYMGWMGRMKFLFKHEKKGLTAEEMAPIYIPGYGKRHNMAWGFSYHLGWRF